MLRTLFSQRLKQLRHQQEITKERFADAVGVSPFTIYRWEHAIDGPEFDNLEKIAQALSVEVWELFDFKDLPRSP